MATEKRMKEVLKIESNIDVDKSRRFFKHVMRNDQFKHDLDISQPDLPKTLTSLLDLSYYSNSNSHDSSGEIEIKGLPNLFDENGRIRFEQTLALFAPSPEMNKREEGLYEQSLCAANNALASYKEKGGEFELVAPLLSNAFLVLEPKPDYLFHVNFLARPKESGSCPELFFAELVACGDLAGHVLKCCILTPRFLGYFPIEASDFGHIWHPEEVFCSSCRE